ncbi:type II toxin-antitoxin system HipA family toxin [Aliamphritea spongicola]|uniref:type II toxin-antitoxin system HipA family toxin n=1 Tax=Aliamphritea spongicola TaxID=707589 RepID=UPI00196B0466|nr:HipA domain-containing protein [Aliamphritea spongicola]MBN3561970.1 HipA domain-containing protein [Aliamphritea spongicola]
MTQQTIEVWRQLTDGSRIRLGTLGENHHSLLFQYHEDCLNSPLNPSPFILPFDDRIHRFSKQAPDAMPGLFTDSLSQHWGLRPLMDFFRSGQQSTVSPTGCHNLLQTTEADLIGSLLYQSDNGEIHAASASTDYYGQLAASHHLSDHVQSLISSDNHIHGMPWQAQVYIDPLIPDQLHSDNAAHLEPWVLQFGHPKNPLGQEQGLADAAYLQMARLAGIDIPEWQLITPPAQSKAAPWLAYRRPDYVQGQGRQHIQRLSSLLNNPWWQPGIGYEQLIRASQLLCQRPATGRDMFNRAVFNLLSCNRDDHSKHWSFVQDDSGQWRPAPMYSAGFRPAGNRQHEMPFNGATSQPDRRSMQQLASLANFSHWHQARQVIEETLDALQNWEIFASQLDIHRDTQRNVRRELDECYQQNRHLLQK